MATITYPTPDSVKIEGEFDVVFVNTRPDEIDGLSYTVINTNNRIYGRHDRREDAIDQAIAAADGELDVESADERKHTLIDSYDALVAWIAANVPIEDNSRTLEEQAFWFVAYCMGEDSSDLGSRDTGLLYLNGIPPMTAERVTEYLEEGYEVESNKAMVTRCLLLRLKRHFFGPR